MRSLKRFASGLRNLLSGARRDRELDAELQAHLTLLIDERVARGMPLQDARREARLEMQGLEQVKEAVRDVRAGVRLEQLWTDLRLAARALRARPALTSVAALTLAIGLGANTALLSVVDAVLLRPLPYPEADRLVLLWGERAGEPRRQVSATDIADVRASSGSFVDVATFSDWTPIVTGAGEAERINGIQVGHGYFDVMGVPPLLGRTFGPDDQIPGTDRVIVLGHAMWQHKFQADPAVVGRTVRMSGFEYEIVGVMPRDLPSLPPTLLNAPGEFYRPVAEPPDDEERGSRHLRAIARLRPGVTLAAAQEEVSAIMARLATLYPRSNAGYRLRVVPLREDTFGRLEPALRLLLAAGFVVLVIGCANLANLLLARAAGREPEMAMRVALGAGRGRLMTHVLAEGLLLSALGAVAGLALAAALLAIMTPLAITAMPQLAQQAPSLNLTVLGLTSLLTVGSALLVSIVPALQAQQFALRPRLDLLGGRVAPAGRLARLLVAGEIALAVMLVFVAGLLLKSFHRLHGVEAGFAIENRLVMNVWLPGALYRDGAAGLRFYSALLQELESQPGVRNVALVSTIPLRSFDQRSIEVEGRPVEPGRVPSPDAYLVSPGYLATMEIPVLEGRGFTEADGEGAPLVAVINRAAARELFGGISPVGRRLRFYDGREASTEPWREIAGVVGDVRQYGLDQPPTLQVYVPHAQQPSNAMVLVVHTSVPPASIVPAVRQQIRALDPNLAAFRVSTMEEIVAGTTASWRLAAWLLASLGALALLLGMVGVFAVMAHWVARATREIGIRMALGATPRQVRQLVLGRGGGLILLGVAAGAGLGLGASRGLTTYLFEVTPGDPAVLAGAVGILALSGLMALYIPARRAARVDPIVPLRGD